VSKRVVVLGGGPAGDVAALRSAQLGAEVTLVERAELGGTCLNWGCIPTKSLLAGADLLRRLRQAADFGIEVAEPKINFPRMMARKEEIVVKQRAGVAAACKRKRVAVVRGQGTIQASAVVVEGTRHEFDVCVLAVGTEPAALPGIDMAHPNVLTSNGVLRLTTLPRSLIILGGGVIGCEYASLFAALGTEVTVVEILPRILGPVDARAAAYFQKFLEKDGVKILTERKLERITDYGKDSISVALDDGTSLRADKLLISIGRTPQTGGIGLEDAGVTLNDRGHIQVDAYLQTANPKFYAVGDCIGGLQLAHKGSAEGHRAAENALGPERAPMDWRVIPSCIYTHPEIAMVGLHVDAAKKAGFEVKAGQARFLGSGKALGEGEPDGYAQIVSDARSDRILGATIIGIHAVEMIHEVAVAMADGLTMSELGTVVHAHPTVSEMVMDAAQQGEGVAAYLS
jgi:dihydrolipoamide dehydrogenase